MSDVPEVNVEVINPEPTAEATAETVIDAAVTIAEKIDEARQEGASEAGDVEQIKYTLDDLWSRLEALDARVGIAIDLMMGLSDQIASLSALEVAEIIETETAPVVEDIVETAEEIADVEPPKEPVETAVTPQIRTKKKTKWL